MPGAMHLEGLIAFWIVAGSCSVNKAAKLLRGRPLMQADCMGCNSSGLGEAEEWWGDNQE